MKTYSRPYYQLIVWIGLLMSLPSLAQNPPPFNCGTDQATAQRLATDSTYRRFYKSLRPNQDKGGVDTTTVYTIPVVFVVYHLGEAVGDGSNVSEAALQAQIDQMNRMFAGQRPDYLGPNTKIRFALARRTPSCLPFDGIARVDARSVPGYEASGLGWNDSQMSDRLRKLLPEFSAYDNDRFVVVRIAHQVYGAGGWASYGGNIFVPAGGMQNTSVYNNLLTHEMGHSLFLSHTFTGTDFINGQYTCPSNTNPEYEGDLVADTDPHRQWEPGNACDPASETAINTCTGQPFGLIGRNYMSYGCNTIQFTRGQMIRMRSYFTENSKGLLHSPYLNPPQADEAVAAACVPTFVQAVGGTDEGLHEIYFQQINRRHEFGQPYVTGHYVDHSCTEQATVTAGQSYSLTMVGRGRFRRVYIDYNNDGVFDEGNEQVLADEMVVSEQISEQTSSGLISFPANTVAGPYLRMRVIVNGGNVAPTACNLPSGQYASGEAHDYSVRVLPTNTPASVAVGTLASAFACRNQQLNIPIITGGNFDANVFTVQLSDATGSFQNPIAIGSSSGSPVPVQLPLSVPLGSDYRLRVVSSSPALTSLPSPTLILDDLPTATISGSQTLLAGQTATLTITLTGRPLWQTRINRNGQTLFQLYDTYTSPISYTFVAQDSDVYTLGYVQNICGYGTVSGAATVSVPCSTPTSLTETQTGLATLQVGWSTSPNVVYSIEWKEISTTNWNHYEYVYGSQYTLNGLEAGKTYQWRVRKWCLDGVSDWTSPRTFTIQCVIPSLPTEQFAETSATLFWQPVPNTLSYRVLWREASSPTWNQSTASSNQLILIGLTAGRVYEWQMQRNCSNEVQSNYTTLRWFSTQCSIPQPGSSSNITGLSVRVSWTGGPVGMRYQVRWRVLGSTNWTVGDSLTTASNLLIAGLPAYSTYEWQVRSVCTLSQLSDYSSSGTFNTNCQPPSSPYVTNIQPTSVQLNWYAAGGTSVGLRWRAVGTTDWNTMSGLSSSISSSFYSLTGLTTGTTYEAQFQTSCSGGASGFSNLLTFTPQCPTPTFMNEQNVTASLAVIQWGVSLTSVSASVEWRTVGSTTWQSSATLTTTTGSSFSYTLTGLTAGHTYEWRIITYCPGGLSTPSASQTFVALCPIPTPSYSYNDADAVVVSYSFKPAVVYQIHWRPVGGTTWTESTTTTSTYYRITGLVIGSPYEWQVRSICSDGSVSDYSSSLTMVAVCPVPDNLSARNIRPGSAWLFWNYQTPTVELRWRPTNSATWTTVSPASANSYSLTGLTNGVTYEWQVRAFCSGSALSAYSFSSFFTTTCRVPTYFYESYVLATSAKVSWYAESDMQYVLQWRQQGAATWQQSGMLTTGNPDALTGLTTGVVYEWRVSTDCDGVLTPSASRTFLTQCVQLTANSLSYYTVSSGAANLGWSASTGLPGLAYRVRWRPVGTTDWTESTTLTGTIYSATGLTNNTVYEWQVQSICDGVGSSYVTAASMFTTNCAASTASPPTLPGDTWVQLNWTIMFGERYDLEYRIATDPTWTSINSLTTNTYQLTTIPGTAYEYRIRTVCSDGSTGTVSNVIAFTTLPACDPNEPNDSFTAATPIPGTSFTSVVLCMNRPFDQDWFRWKYNGYDYYVVMAGSGSPLGSYQLSLDLTGNTLTIKTYPANGSYPYAQLRLIASDGVTFVTSGTFVALSPQQITQQIVYTLPPVCTVMTTLKNGNWTDATVWSCGRLPIATDTVQILHTVTVPASITGRAGRVQYGAGGKLQPLAGSRLVLGQ